MLGAIAGDTIGSIYEGHGKTKREDFFLFDPSCTFTDDTVMTVATAWAILHARPYDEAYLRFGRTHPHRGYGGSFRQWLRSERPVPYGSWGNGSAMRVSPVGFAFDDEELVLEEAARSAAVTHDHPEGIKGAQAVALAVYLARTGHHKESIREAIEMRFRYDLRRTVEAIRPAYRFDVSCQGSVPEAIIAFLDSASYEDAVRKAISLGGDADTQACIAGAIAEAFYGGVPADIEAFAMERLTMDLAEVVGTFRERFCQV